MRRLILLLFLERNYRCSTLGLLLLTVSHGLVLTAPSYAGTIYSFSGDNYTSIFGPGPGYTTPPAYTTSMSVNGSVTFNQALDPNLSFSDQITNITTYSFFDGVQTYTPSNTVVGFANLSTDNEGNIIADWLFALVYPPFMLGIVLENYTDEFGFLNVSTGAQGSTDGGDTIFGVGIVETAGTWALIPEPSTLSSSDTAWQSWPCLNIVTTGLRRRPPTLPAVHNPLQLHPCLEPDTAGEMVPVFQPGFLFRNSLPGADVGRHAKGPLSVPRNRRQNRLCNRIGSNSLGCLERRSWERAI